MVDVSAQFQTKLEALRAYRSQFHNPEYEGPETFVASEAFWDGVAVRARYWGGRIGVQYAEPLYAAEPVAVDEPPGLGARA